MEKIYPENSILIFGNRKKLIYFSVEAKIRTVAFLELYGSLCR